MLTGKLTIVTTDVPIRFCSHTVHYTKVTIQACTAGPGGETANSAAVRVTVQKRVNVDISPSLGPQDSSNQVAGQDGAKGTGYVMYPGDSIVLGGQRNGANGDMGDLFLTGAAGDAVNWVIETM